MPLSADAMHNYGPRRGILFEKQLVLSNYLLVAAG